MPPKKWLYFLDRSLQQLRSTDNQDNHTYSLFVHDWLGNISLFYFGVSHGSQILSTEISTTVLAPDVFHWFFFFFLFTWWKHWANKAKIQVPFYDPRFDSQEGQLDWNIIPKTQTYMFFIGVWVAQGEWGQKEGKHIDGSVKIHHYLQRDEPQGGLHFTFTYYTSYPLDVFLLYKLRFPC